MAKTWYGHEEPEQADDGYWQNGEIISSVEEVKEIPASHFPVLKKYLSVL
jgi:hypothetical protein